MRRFLRVAVSRSASLQLLTSYTQHHRASVSYTFFGSTRSKARLAPNSFRIQRDSQFVIGHIKGFPVLIYRSIPTCPHAPILGLYASEADQTLSSGSCTKQISFMRPGIVLDRLIDQEILLRETGVRNWHKMARARAVGNTRETMAQKFADAQRILKNQSHACRYHAQEYRHCRGVKHHGCECFLCAFVCSRLYST